MAMVHVNHGRLTGQVGGQVYRFLREVAAFWECYLIQVILPTAPAVSNEGRSSELLALAPLFLGPGFRLGARWNRSSRR